MAWTLFYGSLEMQKKSSRNIDLSYFHDNKA